ncbi:MAG: hypothetical protein MHPSP_002498, partial [Paramarteilia canceri]
QHLRFVVDIHTKYLRRPYTPTSSHNQLGEIDFVIKKYPDGMMTNYLDALSIGSSLEMLGPFGTKYYIGKGKFSVDGRTCNYNKILLIAGGTGITPAFSVMQAVFEEGWKNLKMTLIYANK